MLAPNLFKVCTDVSPSCPSESSIYGYYPSLAGNAFLLAWFAVFFFINIIMGFRYKTWMYMIALACGSVCEVVGYIGRLMLHNNPYNHVGFQMQIVTLTIAPAFFAAAIYLTLKHLTLCFGAEYSLIRPAYYTWIFITCDIISLILQGAGGGVSATADSYDKQKAGNDVALAGIVFQVFTLLSFAALAIVYCLRRYKVPRSAGQVRNRSVLTWFMVGLTIAYLLILTRCAYRIAEMAGGWRNSIMVSELDFMVLDGAMIGLAVFVLTACHPGYRLLRFGQLTAQGKEELDEKE